MSCVAAPDVQTYNLCTPMADNDTAPCVVTVAGAAASPIGMGQGGTP